jgi:hypothetical protein
VPIFQGERQWLVQRQTLEQAQTGSENLVTHSASIEGIDLLRMLLGQRQAQDGHQVRKYLVAFIRKERLQPDAQFGQALRLAVVLGKPKQLRKTSLKGQ